MVQYEGPDSSDLKPKLQHGDREIIALYQHESCFTQMNFSQQAWCVLSILPKFPCK